MFHWRNWCSPDASSLPSHR